MRKRVSGWGVYIKEKQAYIKDVCHSAHSLLRQLRWFLLTMLPVVYSAIYRYTVLYANGLLCLPVTRWVAFDMICE